jgi:hypothetical protein
MVYSLPGARIPTGGKSMERRFEIRKQELRKECEVPAAVFAGMMERLRWFA